MNQELGGADKSGLQQTFQQFMEFSPGNSSSVRVFFAPGRVNLIGEHTDYNGGYVLPAALEIGTWVFVRPRGDNSDDSMTASGHNGGREPAHDSLFRFASTSFPQVVEVPNQEVVFRAEDDYANYPKGVIREFQKLGVNLPGMDFLFYGNLPNGAGLSSSASIEVATAAALNAMTGAGLTNERLALLSQAAENQFVGVNCGIMDQFSIAMGNCHHALSLNCATLEYELVPIATGEYQLIITNTNYRRGLADSKYNERRAECDEVVHQLQRIRPELTCLAELAYAEWLELEHYIENPVLKKRARHVVSENQRAKDAVAVLASGDIQAFGKMMNESHISLRDDYEVTGEELDALVEAAWTVGGCIGSRMTGAGFGGCTVSLVKKEDCEAFTEAVRKQYFKVVGLEPSFYVTEIGDGVREVTEEVWAKCQF